MATLGLRPIDVVLTDLLMPDKDGLETIREIVRNFPAVKVLAMSGGGRISSNDYLKIAESFGAAKSIGKPFGQQELLTFLRSV
jgi:YesN/AraC family two-component response regulator